MARKLEPIRQQRPIHLWRARRHDVAGRELQQPWLGLLGLPAPALKGIEGMDLPRHAGRVELLDALLVQQHAAAPQPRLQRLELGPNVGVGGEEARPQPGTAVDKRFPDEQAVGFLRRHAAVVDASSGRDGEPVERHCLACDYVAAGRVPLRLAVLSADQVMRRGLDPGGLNGRDGTRQHPMRFRQRGRHDPARAARLRATAGDGKTQATRAEVVTLLAALAEVAQQARQQRPVQGLIARGHLVHLPAELYHQRGHLGTEIFPLADAQRRQELFPAPAPRLRPGALGPHCPPGVPDVQQGHEVRVRIGELRVAFIGCGAQLLWPLAWIMDAQRSHQCGRLGQRAGAAPFGQHACEARIQRQARHLPAQLGDSPGGVDRLQLLQQAIAVVDQSRIRRVREREFIHGAEPEHFHLQDDAGQVAAQYLRRRKRLARLEIDLVIEADAHAGADASAATLALVGTGPGDRLDRQPQDLAAWAVAADARQAGVHHCTDTRDRDRRLGHVGGQHDAAAAAALEHALLVRPRKPREQRQQLELLTESPGQRLGRFANLPLARQEHQYVAVRGGGPDRELTQGRDDAPLEPRIKVIVLVAAERAVARLDGPAPPRHLDHRRAAEELREAGRVDRGGGDHQPQVRATRQQALQVTQQEVDVEAALVRLVEDQGVVARKVRVLAHLGQQDAIGHHPDQGAVRAAFRKAHLEADLGAQRHAEFLRQPGSHAAGGDAPRLGMPDQAAQPAADLQAGLGNLGRLARTGLAADDHDRVAVDGRADLVGPPADRQVRRIADPGHRGAPRRGATARLLEQPGECLLLPATGPARALPLADARRKCLQPTAVRHPQLGQFRRVARPGRSPRWRGLARQAQRPGSRTRISAPPQLPSPISRLPP